jgi:predicted ATPase
MHELSARRSAGIWPVLTPAMAGWALVAEGRTEDGIATMAEAVQRASAAGVSVFVPIFRCRIAEALLDIGRLEQAGHRLAEAEEQVERTAEAAHLVELLRLQGRLLALEDDAAAAEDRWREALDVARRQGALALEGAVAATMSPRST